MENIANSQTELNKLLYQGSDECNSVNNGLGTLTRAAETATNRIMDGKQNSAFTKSSFKLSAQDDMNEYGMIYFVI